ncbi:MAG: NUDIX hydrolase [Rhizobiaceae bacterium]|nr:NUDIX hydrolase [Rhizobiaceae bacterium]
MRRQTNRNAGKHVVNATGSPIAERIRRLFGGEPLRMQVAALPWRKTSDGVDVMLITSRETGRWVLPKGWPERDEAPCQAAAREAAEEAGLAGSVSSASAGHYVYVKVDRIGGDDVGCEVWVYPLEVDQLASKWKEQKLRTRKWFAAAEAVDLVDEPDLKVLIADFCANPRRSLLPAPPSAGSPQR